MAADLSFEDKQISFDIKFTDGRPPQKITTSLSADSQQHIFVGNPTENGYSGGHDWDIYFENYVKNDSNAEAYFDTNLTAYIVKSAKGQSLIEIMDILRNKEDFPKHHSLFPSDFLRKDGRILNAFRVAYLNFSFGKGANIDLNKNLFYAEVEGVKVAGKFEKNGDHYDIKTFYPDLDWYYRISFRHADEQFSFSRFIKLFRNPWLDCWVWLRTAHFEETDLCEPYLPTPIDVRRVDGDMFLQDASGMIIREKVEDFLNKKFFWRKPQEFPDFNAYMFADYNNPTREELNDYHLAIKVFVPNLNFKYLKKKTIKQNLTHLEIEMKNALKNSNFIFFTTKDNSFYSFPISKEGVRLNLQFFSNMLNLHEGYIRDADTSTVAVPNDLKRISRNFYEKFAQKFLEGSDLFNRMEEQGYFFIIRPQETTFAKRNKKSDINAAFFLQNAASIQGMKDHRDLRIGLSFEDGPLQLKDTTLNFQ